MNNTINLKKWPSTRLHFLKQKQLTHIDGAIEQAHEQDLGPEVLKFWSKQNKNESGGFLEAPRSQIHTEFAR